MKEQETLPNGIIKIKYDGVFSVEDWADYKNTLMELLDASDEKLYILSDFSVIERFAKEIVPEVGTAPHLTHPNLGLIVLYGGNALQNFILQITAHRAQKDHRDSKMRVHTDYDRAIETLLYFQKMHNEQANLG